MVGPLLPSELDRGEPPEGGVGTVVVYSALQSSDEDLGLEEGVELHLARGRPRPWLHVSLVVTPFDPAMPRQPLDLLDAQAHAEHTDGIEAACELAGQERETIMGSERSGSYVDIDARSRRGRHRRRVLASAVGSVVVVAVTMAGAQWVATGVGNGSAKARKAEPLRTVSTEPTASLYPGGTGDLVLTVANDNPYDINLTRVSPNGVATSGLPECDDPGNGVSFTEVSGSWLVPRNGTGTFVLAGSVAMAETSPDACQEQSFTIPVALTGAQRTGPIAPRLTLSPTSAAFADQEVGTTSAPQQFTVRNVGNAETTDLTLALAGTEAASYTITADTCGQLAAGASCIIDVAARPTKRAANLPAELRVSAAGESQVATLSVKGTQAVVVPSSSDFGNVQVGQEKVLPVQVRNIGENASGPITLIFSRGSTTPAGTFNIVDTNCMGRLLDPGHICTVNLRFTPPHAASFAGQLIVFAEPGTPPNGNGGTQAGTGVA